MNTGRILTILVAASLSIGVATAIAQQGGRGFGPGHGGPDRGQRMMTEADTDGDGLVSQAEFEAFRAERQAAMAAEGRPMRNLDKAPAFTDLDIDGDGYIASDELEVFRAERQATMGGRGERGPKHGGPGRQGGQRLQQFDSDADGYLNESEFLAAHEARQAQRIEEGRPVRDDVDPVARFQELDSDGDGLLSLDELRAGRPRGQGPRNS